jgi:hypothetical protein
VAEPCESKVASSLSTRRSRTSERSAETAGFRDVVVPGARARGVSELARGELGRRCLGDQRRDRLAERVGSHPVIADIVVELPRPPLDVDTRGHVPLRVAKTASSSLAVANCRRSRSSSAANREQHQSSPARVRLRRGLRTGAPSGLGPAAVPAVASTGPLWPSRLRAKRALVLNDVDVLGKCDVELSDQSPLARRVSEGRLDRVARECREVGS